MGQSGGMSMQEPRILGAALTLLGRPGSSSRPQPLVPAVAARLGLRWRRFQRDCSAAASFRIWLPVILGSTLVSGLILAASASQSERNRNDLIRRYANEQLDFIATDLAVETMDWSIWDESYRHAQGLHPTYYDKGNYTQNTFVRTPFVMVLDRRGDVVSTAHWDASRRRIAPLSATASQELLRVIPQRHRLETRTFLAMFQGRPYLMSAQPIRMSRGDAPAAGRLLFVRSLGTQDNQIIRHALAVQDYRFEPARALSSPPLGPLAIAIRNPRWDGDTPLQITVRRPATERLGALRAFALLLLLDAALLVFLMLRAYRQQRRERHQSCRQQQAQRHLQRALHRRENLDELTGLLNGHGLLAAMEQQRLHHPERSRALLLVDIKHFSLINNSFGRQFGDQVLISFGQHLKKTLHASSLISRTGGDEFACSLVGASHLSLRAEITRITHDLQQLDLPVDGQVLCLSVSAGARIISDTSTEKALHETGLARDLAKISGRMQCQFFGDEQATLQNYIAIQRLNQDLIASLKESRIVLFSQAAWRLNDPDLPAVYVEFLSRIHDRSQQKYLWSEALVEAATTCGTMPLLDSHVLALSFHNLHQMFARQQNNPAVHNIVYAINITPETLLADDFIRTIEQLLEREDIAPSRICLEITEQAAMRNLERVISVMRRLRQSGLHFSLDDFGAGMTSLSHLRDLPLDYVKIDKAFIWKMQEDPASHLTVDFVVRMGQELGFEVIAEGVETLELLQLLRDLGVSIAQGYFTSIPAKFDPLSPEAPFASCGRELLSCRG